MSDGLLDTNVFLHAHTTDALSVECQQFLAALEAGTVRAQMEPLVLHELSYALKHYLKQMTRQDIAQYLLTVLGWKGVTGEKDTLAQTVQRWVQTPGLAFVDAYLAELAQQRDCPVYTKNVRKFRAQGVVVPNPLLVRA
jgi:predicted nucleic acid-binding protein